MKKITESALKEKATSLKEYLSVLENEQQVSELGWTKAMDTAYDASKASPGASKVANGAWNAIKNGAGAAYDAVKGGANAVYDAGKAALSTTAGKAGAAGVAAGAGGMAALSGGNAQGGKPAAWPTTPQEITAFQTAHGLKPDGMIGQKTMAALQQAGATPPAGFKAVGNKVHAPAAPRKPSIDAATAAKLGYQGGVAASQPVAGGNGQWDGQADTPVPGASAPITKTSQQAVRPSTTPQQPTQMAESVQYDELQRVVSLVHYR
jgi:hypothetical protein